MAERLTVDQKAVGSTPIASHLGDDHLPCNSEGFRIVEVELLEAIFKGGRAIDPLLL